MNETTTGLPNLSPQKKKQTLERIKHALGWSFAVLDDKPRQIAKEWIDQNLGPSSKPLGSWLRAKLLICTNEKFYGDPTKKGQKKSAGDYKCKEYILNVEGYQEVKAVYFGAEPTPGIPAANPNAVAPDQVWDLEVAHQALIRAHRGELDSKDFQYVEKNSARLWHPLQNIRRATKTVLWAQEGLVWNYDIQACAPTLIMQYAQQLGHDEYMFGIMDYLKDTKGFRQHVASIAGISERNAKALVNALFCGARLGASEHYALFQLVGNNKAAIRAISSDPRVTALRADIKACWQIIATTMPVATNDSGRKLPLSSKRKWGKYFEMERAVLNVVRAYLMEQGITCFLEHDGFRTNKEVDVARLQELIYVRLGFRVVLTGDFIANVSTGNFFTNTSSGNFIANSSRSIVPDTNEAIDEVLSRQLFPYCLLMKRVYEIAKNS